MDVLAITNKGAEIPAKNETDTVVGKLFGSTKISWDGAAKKVSFENMLTTQAKGMPPNIFSSGIAMDTENPIPAYRTKITLPKIEERAGRHLVIAENVGITIDLRPRGNDPDIRNDAVPVHAMATHSSWGANAVHFAERHSLEIGAGLLVGAAIASNFVTFGADAPVDVPAVALAGGMLRTAAAMAR